LAQYRVVEICAGAGGQSLGLELAGFEHDLSVELDANAAATLRHNRPHWKIAVGDVANPDVWNPADFVGVDLLAGGVPCPPFSIAGKQLGADDERDLFPQALRLVEECEPAAVMLENVRGLSTARFARYRDQVVDRLRELGYETEWQVLNASEFGVPQLRPRFILVAMTAAAHEHFEWPKPVGTPPTVGETLRDLMAARGWPGAEAWAQKASGIGPTLVGGSRKHGGPDLGPTRAREAWLRLHVDGKALADASPGPTDPVQHIPRLTLHMAAALQGFPRDWLISGRKTAGYRQIGNAFPPPVAQAVGRSIRSAIEASREAEEAKPTRLLREAS
jgi:DNA (cytosine-5)-methyltransferase 1